MPTVTATNNLVISVNAVSWHDREVADDHELVWQAASDIATVTESSNALKLSPTIVTPIPPDCALFG
jgi:hypothetical protein